MLRLGVRVGAAGCRPPTPRTSRPIRFGWIALLSVDVVPGCPRGGKGSDSFAEASDATILKDASERRRAVDIERFSEFRDPDFDLSLEPRGTIVVPICNLQVFVTGTVNAPGKSRI